MGLSFPHLLIILVIILVLFGANRLPGLGKSMGEAIRGFKKGLEGDEIDVTARREQLRDGEQSGDQQTQKDSEKTKS